MDKRLESALESVSQEAIEKALEEEIIESVCEMVKTQGKKEAYTFTIPAGKLTPSLERELEKNNISRAGLHSKSIYDLKEKEGKVWFIFKP